MNTFLKGLIAAAIGGALSSAAAMTVDSGDLKQSFAKMGVVAAAGAITAVFAYLKQSPLQKS